MKSTREILWTRFDSTTRTVDVCAQTVITEDDGQVHRPDPTTHTLAADSQATALFATAAEHAADEASHLIGKPVALAAAVPIEGAPAAPAKRARRSSAKAPARAGSSTSRKKRL